MTVEIISLSISTKVWDRAGIELATTGSAGRLTSVARHIMDCTTQTDYFLKACGFTFCLLAVIIIGGKCYEPPPNNAVV